MDKQIIEISVFGSRKISVVKALIPVKLSLFLWFGASYSFISFFPMFLKQKGFTLGEFSSLTAFTAVGLFFGPTLSGVLADKVGRAKPILISYLIIYALSMISLVPLPKLSSCFTETLNLECINDTIGLGSAENCSRVRNLRLCEAINSSAALEFSEIERVTCTNKRFDMKNTSEIQNLSGDDLVCSYDHAFLNGTLTTVCRAKSPPCEIECQITKCSKRSKGFMVLYSILYSVSFFTYTTVYRFYDVIVIALMKELESDFGKHRIFSMTGGFVGSLVTGFLVRALSPENSPDYTYAILVSLVLTILCCTSTFLIEVSVKPPAKNMWKKTLSLLKNFDALVSALALAMCGLAFNFTTTFSGWFLENIGASAQLIGIISAASNLYGLPFLYTSRWWLDLIGGRHIFALALFLYFINTLAYSYLTNPWFALLIELTQIITFNLCWVNAVEFFEKLAPQGLKSTVVISTGVVHYIFGRIASGSIGGILKSQYDDRETFRIFSIICLINASLYFTYLVLRRIYLKYQIKKSNRIKIERRLRDSQEE